MRTSGPKSKDHPLLRTLVVCGVSLVGLGCGGKAATRDGSEGGAFGSSSTAPVGGAAAVCPEHCSSPAQYFCDESSTPARCYCDAAAPRAASECVSVWDFSCGSPRIADDCAPFIALGATLSCECSSGRPHPEDCEFSARFRCAAYEPSAVSCACDTGGPIGPADCAPGEQYSCYYREPDVDCRCARIEFIK